MPGTVRVRTGLRQGARLAVGNATEPALAHLHERPEGLEVRPQGRFAQAGQPVRKATVLRGERLDQSARLQPRDRRVEPALPRSSGRHLRLADAPHLVAAQR